MTIEHELIEDIRDTLEDLVTILPYMDEKTISDSIDWLGRALDSAKAVRDIPEEERGQYEKGLCKYPFSSCKECGGKDVDVMDWICNKEYCITKCATCGNFSIMPSIPFKPKGMSTAEMADILRGVVDRSEARLKDSRYEERHTGSDGDMYYLKDD